MQDPATTICALLQDQWTLTENDNMTGVISFRQGEPSNADTRFTPHKISIECKHISSGAKPRNQLRTVFYEIVGIDIWVRIADQTETGKNSALTLKRQIIDECRRIIKANQSTATDIDYMSFAGDNPLDKPSGQPPYFRVILNIVCQYNV